MTAWLRRNTAPIMIIVVASALVIAVAELLNAFTTSERVDTTDADAALHVGGLVKVAIFLAVPGAITLAVRRRQSPPM